MSVVATQIKERCERRRPFADEVLRRRARIHDVPLDRFKVKLARSADELEDAFKLLHDAYVERGLERPREGAMRITPQHVLAESLVFVVYEDSQAIGTMTMTKDSPVGLPLDKDYPQELAGLRERGDVAEFGSFAVSRKWRYAGVPVLLSMTAHWVVRNIFRASYCAIGVNPACEGYYRAVYNFSALGPRQCHAELSAPVVGLHHETRQFEHFCKKHFRIPMQSGRLPHEHFCFELPECVDIPASVCAGDAAGLKLTRRAFREFFIQRTKQIYSLDPETRRYLKSQRSPETLHPTHTPEFPILRALVGLPQFAEST